MALTITTDLQSITDAEGGSTWVNITSGGASAIEPDFYAQGSNSRSRAVSGAGTRKGMAVNYGSGINLTANGGLLVYMWLRNNTPSLIETVTNNGMAIRIGTTESDYYDWTISGSDFLTFSSTTGWAMFVIDVNAPASVVGGGGLTKTSAQYFGAHMQTTANAKGQNIAIDRISYGKGILRATGTSNDATSGLQEMIDWDWGNVNNRWGILTERGGIAYCKGKLSVGDASGTAATSFGAENTIIAFEPTWYYHPGTGSIRPTVGYTSAGAWNDGRDTSGVPYYGIQFVGNGTGNTDVQFGQKVGTGDTASGRNGPILIGSTQLPTTLSGDDGAVEATKLYGTTFQNFRRLDLSSNASTDEFIGNTLITCGTTQAGPVQLRNNLFVDGLGGAYRFLERFFNYQATASEALATADPITDWLNVLNGSNLAVPSATAGYVHLLAAATQRNVVQVTADVVGADDHYVDAVVRFPTGTSQGTIGITIRGAAGTTENYYYLRLDRPNNQVTLIRCDAGTDTTIAGPTAMTLSADTDYQAYIRGSGTTIEAFVSGGGVTTKLSATGQTSYQTNRRVGIRGTTNGSQSASAQPRVRRFGAGPYTDHIGSVKFPATASNNTQFCSFINNARAATIPNAETYSFISHK